MQDSFGRQITYARLSVTDRCNLRCQYCMPSCGIEKVSHKAILSLESLGAIATALHSLGITKLRITGGEPLVRRGVNTLFETLACLNFDTLALTTNGINIPDNIAMLMANGVNAINISLDTLSPSKYTQITRGGDFAAALKGIEVAKKYCQNVKVNVVYIKDFNDNEVEDFIAFSKKMDIPVRFIELMPFNNQLEFFLQHAISTNDILLRYPQAKAHASAPSPAAYYDIDGAKIGIIAPISHKFCEFCNRVRIAANGDLINCLHSSEAFSLVDYLSDMPLLERKISEFVALKPLSHHIADGCVTDNIIGKIGG